MDRGEAVGDLVWREVTPALAGYRFPLVAAPRPPVSPPDPYELFRRAVVEGNQGAWEALCAQYQGLVRSWLRRHPAATLVDESDDYLVNRTFERFWRGVGPARFATFRGLPALLSYLKLCAQSVVLDEARARAKRQAVQLEGWEQVDGFEEAIAEQAAAHALWRAIRAAVRDESELLIARLSFIQGLKPREIRERYPERYADVAEVYRLKRNLLDRLRRDATILLAYTGDTGGHEAAPTRELCHAGAR